MAQTRAYAAFGWACTALGRYAEALEHLDKTLTLAEKTGDPIRLGITHRIIAWCHGERGDDRAAFSHATRSVSYFRSGGQVAEEALSRTELGRYATRLGDYDRARAELTDALTLFRRNNRKRSQAIALDCLGQLAQRTDRPEDAEIYYQQAVTLLEDVGDSFTMADILDRLAEAYLALNKPKQARHTWEQALRLYQAQRRTAGVRRVRQRLAGSSEGGEAFAQGVQAHGTHS